MVDEKLRAIRRANLRRWVDEDPIAQGNVSKWCDHYSLYLDKNEKPFSPPHIRQYIPQGDKPAHGNIGESVARKIERATGRASGSMDEPHPLNQGAINENRAVYGRKDNQTDSAASVARAFRAAPDYQQAVIEAILGIRRFKDLPEGVGDAIRLGLKLASPGRKGGRQEEVA